MKLPEPLKGARRRSTRIRSDRTALRARETGIVPQDEYCEDVCWDTYEEGSDHEECLQSCWED